MAETTEAVLSCTECGASIYPEHISRHTAEYLAGKLFCGHCIGAKRAASPPTNPSIATNHDTPAPALAPAEDELPAQPVKTKIQTLAPIHRTDRTFVRALNQGATGATRCRTFHCRLTEAAMAYMNEQVNEWVDSHPEIEIKFATNVIAALDGKAIDQQLILTLFY